MLDNALTQRSHGPMFYLGQITTHHMWNIDITCYLDCVANLRFHAIISFISRIGSARDVREEMVLRVKPPKYRCVVVVWVVLAVKLHV